MKNITIHHGKLEIIERLPQSKNGNPRYLCRVNGWTCRTPPDSDLAYSIPNLDGAEVWARLGTYYGHCSIDAIWPYDLNG